MPAEPNLRHLFGTPPLPPIDTAAVLRRSRARRVPKLLGLGAATVLAIGGISVLSLQGLGLGGGASNTTAEAPMESGAADQAQTFDDEIKRAPAEKLNLCTAPLAEVAPSQTGLVLAVHFADAAAASSSVEGTVTMTNTGSQRWEGYTAASPAITLSQNGVVLWHSNGPVIQLAREVSLAPGESMEYSAFFVPVVCGVEDDLAESFRNGLPAVPSGQYQVSAAIDLMGDFPAELVTGPAQTITLN